LSFTIFEKTQIQTVIKENIITSFDTGKEIMSELQDSNKQDNLKLIISFTDGLVSNGEEYLNGITSINSDVIIAGGMAGDNAKFEETFVFNEDTILNAGAVAVGFYSDDLKVHTDYNFNWETVGKQHIVEKSYKNIVYKIGGMTTVDFYKYYLGDKIADLLPAIGIEFPLVIKNKGINQARAVLTKHDDGSLSFAGNIQEGSIVQFGHGDVQMIINKGLSNISTLFDYPSEAIFIFSCMARHALLKGDVNLEILPYRQIAPIAGFFTYGEFYHNISASQNNLLNQSMTLLSISENDRLLEHIDPNIFNSDQLPHDTLSLYRTQALSILIERTTKELYELNANLEKRVEQEIEKNYENEKMIQVMQTQAQLGDMIEMILHQWRQPLSAISTVVSSAQLYQEMGTLSDDMIKKTFANITQYVDHINVTISDFRDLFSTSTKFSNITMEKLINKSLTIVGPSLKKNNIELVKEFYEDSTISIPISLIMQVIINIIKNAIDVINENNISNPKIIIKSYVKKNRAVIRIFDNGGGIPKDILPMIFDKKFTTKGDTHGTGLGLDMSKNIIEQKLGGKLTANNYQDGAVFNIKIPIAN
jgi:signal transduction histidine kinase